MAEYTKIEWATHTFNGWRGCTKVSPGCKNCYAEKLVTQRLKGEWGPGAPRQLASEAMWKQPLKWDREAAKNGTRPRVFCSSLADVLDNEVPTEWLADLLRLICRTPHLDWLLLTKRPETWTKRMEAVKEIDGDSLAWTWLRGIAPANVWIGTSVEDQERADERIPALLDIPAKVRFLSCEPLLGPVEITGNYALTGQARRVDKSLTPAGTRARIHWVIVGGESGPNARPMHPDWARDLRDQCAAAGVPFLFKQWGEWGLCQPEFPERYEIVSMFPDGRVLTMDEWSEYCRENGNGGRLLHWNANCLVRAGKKHTGRLLDGKAHNGFPEGSA